MSMVTLKELFDIDEERLLRICSHLNQFEYNEWAIQRLEDLIREASQRDDFHTSKQSEMWRYRDKAIKHFYKNLEEMRRARENFLQN